MTRLHHIIVTSWLTTIKRAIELGEDDVAYRLTIGFIRRLYEIGLL